MADGTGISQHQRPRFSYLHHISLPCRDLEQSKRFYTQVLGGELIHDIAGFAEVRIADIIIGMSEQPGGWTEPNVEYPHYGLNVDGQNFALALRWLKIAACRCMAGRAITKPRCSIFAIHRAICSSFTATTATTAFAIWRWGRARRQRAAARSAAPSLEWEGGKSGRAAAHPLI